MTDGGLLDEETGATDEIDVDTDAVAVVSPEVDDDTFPARTNRETNGGREKDWWVSIEGEVADEATDDEVDPPPPLAPPPPPPDDDDPPNGIRRLGRSRLK